MTGRICESFVTGYPLVSASSRSFSLPLSLHPSLHSSLLSFRCESSFSRSLLPRRICLRTATKADTASLFVLLLSSFSCAGLDRISRSFPSISLFSAISFDSISVPRIFVIIDADVVRWMFDRQLYREKSELQRGFPSL